MLRSIYSERYRLADTFTHVVVSYATGQRVFVGQLSACEKLAASNHALVVGRIRPSNRKD